jgi:protein-disulfide isomerase
MRLLFWRGKDRPNPVLLPEGKLSYSFFAGATAVAVVVVALLIFIGRMGYARADFVLLPPNYGSPSVSLPPALPSENPGGPSSPSEYTYGTSMGLPTAPVTIVVYSDFLCRTCQDFALTTEKELEKAFIETGQVRLVYKNFFVYGSNSVLAAEAAECAAEQGKFWPYHDLLMQTNLPTEMGKLSIAELEDLAGQAGLDTRSFDDSLTSGKYKEKVLGDDAEARQLGVTGPPTFFINRMKGSGYKTFEAFQKVINEILERSAG